MGIIVVVKQAQVRGLVAKREAVKVFFFLFFIPHKLLTKSKMGKIKTEDMDNKEIFLGNFTQKGFYDALHFLREHGGHK